MSSHPCQLINPSKNELGKISKAILEKKNDALMKSLNLNQWKDSNQMISWFKYI